MNILKILKHNKKEGDSMNGKINRMKDELDNLDYIYGHPKYKFEPLYKAQDVWAIINKYLGE